MTEDVPNDSQAEAMAEACKETDWCFRPKNSNMKWALERRGWGKCVYWMGRRGYYWLELTEAGKQALARYRTRMCR